jgi:hypothetical protein
MESVPENWEDDPIVGYSRDYKGPLPGAPKVQPPWASKEPLPDTFFPKLVNGNLVYESHDYTKDPGNEDSWMNDPIATPEEIAKTNKVFGLAANAVSDIGRELKGDIDVAQQTPPELRKDVLSAVSHIASQEPKYYERNFVDRSIGAVASGIGSLGEMVYKPIERYVGNFEPDQEQFLNQIRNTRDTISPEVSPEASLLDPREWAVGAAAMYPSVRAVEALGTKMTAGAIGAGVPKLAASLTGQTGAAAAVFGKPTYDASYSQGIQEGLDPETAHYVALGSMVGQSILFGGLPGAVWSKAAWGAGASQQEINALVGKKAVEVMASHLIKHTAKGSAIMASAGAIDAASHEFGRWLAGQTDYPDAMAIGAAGLKSAAHAVGPMMIMSAPGALKAGDLTARINSLPTPPAGLVTLQERQPVERAENQVTQPVNQEGEQNGNTQKEVQVREDNRGGPSPGEPGDAGSVRTPPRVGPSPAPVGGEVPELREPSPDTGSRSIESAPAPENGPTGNAAPRPEATNATPGDAAATADAASNRRAPDAINSETPQWDSARSGDVVQDGRTILDKGIPSKDTARRIAAQYGGDVVVDTMGGLPKPGEADLREVGEEKPRFAVLGTREGFEKYSAEQPTYDERRSKLRSDLEEGITGKRGYSEGEKVRVKAKGEDIVGTVRYDATPDDPSLSVRAEDGRVVDVPKSAVMWADKRFGEPPAGEPSVKGEAENAPEPAATPRDFGSPEAPNRIALGEHFGEQFDKGKSYGTILEARKEAGELLGTDVRTNPKLNKEIDEAVEQGVVRAARNAAAGKTPWESLLDLYERQPNLASRTSGSVEKQAYCTPAPLAKVASSLAGIDKTKSVYEPTAGNGMLLMDADPDHTYANELDPGRAAMLRALGFSTTENDASKPAGAFQKDVVIANPPFGTVHTPDGKKVAWDIDGVKTDQVDHAIALEALSHMKSDGSAVLILGAKGKEGSTPLVRGKAYRNRKPFYDKLYNEYNVVDHFTVDGDLYSKQGASFPVDVIVIKGHYPSSRPKPYNINENGIPKWYSSWEDLYNDKLANRGAVEAPSVGPERTGPAGGPAEADRPGHDVGEVPESSGAENRLDGGTAGQPVADRGGTMGGEAGRLPGPTEGPVEVSPAPSVPEHPNEPVRPESGELPATGGEPEGLRERDSGTEQPVGLAGDVPAGRGAVEDDGPPGPSAEGKMPAAKDIAAAPPDLGVSSAGENAFQVASPVASTNPAMDACIPRGQSQAYAKALERVQERQGPMDQFVQERLGFTPEQAKAAFSAQQVDTLGLVFDNHEKGLATVIGHQTGFGKGRIIAGIMEYAKRKSLIPLFLTKSPDLLSSQIDAMTEVGLNTPEKPFTFLATGDFSGRSKVKLSDGRVISQTGEEAKRICQEAAKNYLKGKGLTAKVNGKSVTFDAIFTTYPQIQTVAKSEPWRRNFLRSLASNSFVISDEAHNAGGGGTNDRAAKNHLENRAEFARTLVGDAAGVAYSTATWAKHPGVLDLYFRSGLGAAVDDPKKLPEIFHKLGIPGQQMASEMMTEGGYLTRLEQSWDGIDFHQKVIPTDLSKIDSMTEIFRSINDFDRAKEESMEAVESTIVSQGGMLSADNAVGNAGVESTQFSSILWNLVDQMIFASKADVVADEAIQHWKEGKAVFVAVDNTLESVLQGYADQNELNAGDKIDIDFRDLLQKYLDRSRRITLKGDKDDKSTWERRQLTDEELGPVALQLFEKTQGLINKFEKGVTASPIDRMIYKMRQAGMNVKEITGRQMVIDYRADGSAILTNRPDTEVGSQGKLASVAGFNDGTVDVIIGNRSSAEGISAHASEKNPVAGQKRRVMLVAQAAKNIDEFMQILGRINRTGQIREVNGQTNMPMYVLPMTDVPAELRPAATLTKKLRNLNANVTANAESAINFNVPDIINKIGDEAIIRWFSENSDAHHMIGSPLSDDVLRKQVSAGDPGAVARKLSGRVALLPVEMQQAFWDDVTAMFNSKIEELEQSGQNPLEAKTLPLEAKTTSRFKIADGNDESDNPFEHSAYVDEVDAKKVGQSMSSKEIKKRLKASGGKQGDMSDPDNRKSWTKESYETLRKSTIEYLDSQLEGVVDPDTRNARRQSMSTYFDKVTGAMRQLAPGTTITYDTMDGGIDGIVLGFSRTGKAKNPSAPSAWTVEVALADSTRVVKIPVSQIAVADPALRPSYSDFDGVLKQFDDARTTSREKRYIATGNVIAAAGKLEGVRAQPTFFTDNKGNIQRGLLLPKNFDVQQWAKNKPIVMSKSSHSMEAVEAGITLTSPDHVVSVMKSNGILVVRVPISKRTGGAYFLNKPLQEAANNEFVSRGGIKMELYVTEPDRQQAAIDALMRITSLQAESNRETARKIVGETIPTAEAPKPEGPQVRDWSDAGGSGKGPPKPPKYTSPPPDDNGEDSTRVYGSVMPAMLPSVELGGAFKNHADQIRDLFGNSHLPKLSRTTSSVRDAAFSHAYASQAARPIVADLLQKVFGNKPSKKEMADVADVLNADNILGIYDASLSSGHMKWAEDIKETHDLDALDAFVQEKLNDPKITEQVELWKTHVNPYLNELYNEVKMLDKDTPQDGRGRHTDARINLLTLDRAAKWGEFRENNTNPMPQGSGAGAGAHRNPDVRRDSYMRRAKGTGEYSNDLETNLMAVVGPRYNQATKVRFYQSLVDSRVAVLEPPRQAGRRFEFKGPEGYERIPVDLPVTDPETLQTHINERGAIWVRNDLVGETKRILNTDMKGNPLWWADILTKVQLLSQADAVSHSLNLWRTITNSQGAESTLSDVLRKIPFLSGADSAVRIVRKMSDVVNQTPDVVARTAELAKIGAIRPAYQTKWPGAKAIHAIDTASRLVLDDFFTNLVKRGSAKDTPGNRRDFINQLGVYNRRVMGKVEQNLRDYGLSPFIVAGKTMNRVARRAVLGNPGFEAASKAAATEARLVQLSKLALIPTMAAIANYMNSGSPFGRPGTPLGSIDLGDDEKGRRKILDIFQVEGLSRGLRSLGLRSLMRDVQQGRNANQVMGDMLTETIQTVMHPFTGPGIGFLSKALTGSQFMDMRGQMEAERIPEGGMAQKVENTRAAMEAQNPLMYGVGKSLARLFGVEVSGTPKEDADKAILEQAVRSYGVTTMAQPTTAAGELAKTLLTNKLGSGITEDERHKIEAKQPALAAFRKGDVKAGTEAVSGLLKSGDISHREAVNLRKKGQMTDLQWRARNLSTQELKLVWKEATQEERLSLRPLVRSRIVRKQKPEDRKALIDMANSLKTGNNPKSDKLSKNGIDIESP